MSEPSVHSPASLERLRRQARALVKGVRAGDPQALARVRALLPRFGPDSPFLLSDAQFVIARERGFASWPRMKSALESAPSEDAPVPAAGERKEPAPPAERQPASPSLPISQTAVRARTGRGWDDWLALLDAAGAARRSHKEIVAIVSTHGADPWWGQMVAVGYEQARGLRVPNQSCAGHYQVSVTRTIAAPVEAVFAAWTDEALRARWLPGAPLAIRKATPAKSVRITWNEGGSVEVNLYPAGDQKCRCSAQHNKLADASLVEPMRGHWSAALDRLKSLLEAARP